MVEIRKERRIRKILMKDEDMNKNAGKGKKGGKRGKLTLRKVNIIWAICNCPSANGPDVKFGDTKD